MGVKGLWKVLESEGVFKNCEVEPCSLKGKIIAVDVSIWLYQFVKSVPSGNDSSISPLVIGGLFKRVCKLLYFGIKPVFVFDGAAPTLKKETVSARQELRRKADMDFSKLAKKILRNKLKLAAIEEISGSNKDSKPYNNSPDRAELNTNPKGTPPIDFLTILEHQEDMDHEIDSGSEDYDINFNSKEFKNLPFDIKEQILLESRKRTIDTSQIADIPSGDLVLESPKKLAHALDFSKAQVDALIKRRKLMDELDSLRGNSSKKTSDLGVISHGKIASSSEKRYIFSKNPQVGWSLSLTDSKSKNEEDRNQVESVLERKNEKVSSISDVEDDSEFLKMMFGDAEGLSLQKVESNSLELNQDISPHLMNTPKYISEESEFEIDLDIPDKASSQQKKLELDLDYFTVNFEDHERNIKLVTENTIKLPEIILKDLIKTKKTEETEILSNSHEIFTDISSSYSDLDNEMGDLDIEYKTFIEEVSSKIDKDSNQFSDLVSKLQNELKEYHALSESSSISGISPTKALIDTFKELLHFFNLPFIIAPFEAEAQCSVIEGIDGIISDDSDCLLFGASIVYRRFFSGSKIEMTSMVNIEEITGLSRNDLIVLAYLLGCDYCTGVEGIGPKRALEIVRQVKSSTILEYLEKIVSLSQNNESKYSKWLKDKITEDFIDLRISQAFLNPNVIPVNVNDLKWGKLDQSKLEKFMSIHAKWAKDKTASYLKDLEKKNK